MIFGTCPESISNAFFLCPASQRKRLDPLLLETFAKGSGRASRPEPSLNQGDSRTKVLESGDRDQLQTTPPGIELDPGVPSQGPGPSMEPAPLWAPSYEVFRDPVRSDATVLRTGGAGSNTASALSEVARFPADMAVWKQSINQEVIDNLRRRLMMVGSLICSPLFFCP
jgi:hypothetical protein